MNATCRPVPMRELSEQEVLVVLIHGAKDLAADSTLAEWQDELDLFATSPLLDDESRWVEDVFAVKITREEAKAVLRPAKTRTLEELARFIAGKRPQVPVIKAALLGGAESLEAGAFRALQAALAMRGVKRRVRPSTPVRLLLRSPAAFMNALDSLAPDRFGVRERRPAWTRAGWWVWLAGMLSTMIGLWMSNPLMAAGGAAAAAVALACSLLFHRLELVGTRGGSLESTGDLCRELAAVSAEHPTEDPKESP